jgi:hypothetical protein
VPAPSRQTRRCFPAISENCPGGHDTDNIRRERHFLPRQSLAALRYQEGVTYSLITKINATLSYVPSSRPFLCHDLRAGRNLCSTPLCRKGSSNKSVHGLNTTFAKNRQISHRIHSSTVRDSSHTANVRNHAQHCVSLRRVSWWRAGSDSKLPASPAETRTASRSAPISEHGILEGKKGFALTPKHHQRPPRKFEAGGSAYGCTHTTLTYRNSPIRHTSRTFCWLHIAPTVTPSLARPDQATRPYRGPQTP